MNNLAVTLVDLGDAAGAADLHGQVLDARRRLLGPEHPDTLMSINNLAATLVDLGDLVAAEDLLQQAVHAYQQFLGPEHPHTLKATSNLTWIQRALDEPAS
jgi:hypothetical protein